MKNERMGNIYVFICIHAKQLHPLNVRFVEELLAFLLAVVVDVNFLSALVYELKMLYYLKEIIIIEKE